MNFTKLQASDSRYQNQFGNLDIQHFHLYTGHHSIGKVSDVLIDEAQNYYLLVETGSWLSRKQEIFPLKQFQIAPADHRITMPDGTASIARDAALHSGASEASRSIQPQVGLMSPVEQSAPLEASAPLEFPAVDVPVYQRHESTPAIAQTVSEPGVVHSAIPAASVPQTQLPDRSSIVQEEVVRLLEERLVVDRQRRKMGDVIVRKVIETQMVEVPVQREKLIVEQISPDRRQLASIDLPSQSENLVLKPPQVAPVSSTQFSDAQFGSEGIPISVAQQILEKLQQSRELSQTRVHLQFENTNLQSQYQSWLQEHYRRTP